MKLHSLLKRQIIRSFGSMGAIPSGCEKMITSVNEAYWQMDADREMLERSLDLSSQELLHANSEMRAVFQAFPDLLFRTDHSGTIVDYQTSDGIGLHITREKVIGKQIGEIFPRNVGEKFDKAIDRTQKERSIVSIEYSAGEQNNEHWYEARLLPLLESEIVILVRDITVRRQAEEELQENQTKLQAIFNKVGTGILIIDSATQIIVEANQTAIEMTGLPKEKIIGQICHSLVCPAESGKCPVKDLGQTIDRSERKLLLADGQQKDILKSVYPITIKGRDCYLESFIDISDRLRAERLLKESEARLQRAEKMEALGTLTGGVAHDLNNILGVLGGYSELLLLEMAEGHPWRKDISKIMQSSQRAAAIIEDLLTLTRRGVAVSEVINLNNVITGYFKTPEFEKLKANHPRVALKANLDHDLLNIKGSPVHLGKTIMNLVSNAAEAISGQGEVTVKTKSVYIDRSIKGYDEVKQGDYVVLMVSDSGRGISSQDIEKIFEPFYTKKVMGRSGTGLGLSVVWGTVKDHNGHIDVQSDEGKGTTFTLYFPVTREKISDDQTSISVLEYTGNGESILVVDDVEGQRELAAQMLEKLNYTVATVSSGEEALKYLRDNKADLIVLDMIMDPGIDGLDTYEGIIKINPEQKTIIVSGYSETERVKKAQELGAGAYVRKPYILEKIGLAVRKELDRI